MGESVKNTSPASRKVDALKKWGSLVGALGGELKGPSPVSMKSVFSPNASGYYNPVSNQLYINEDYTPEQMRGSGYDIYPRNEDVVDWHELSHYMQAINKRPWWMNDVKSETLFNTDKLESAYKERAPLPHTGRGFLRNTYGAPPISPVEYEASLMSYPLKAMYEANEKGQLQQYIQGSQKRFAALKNQMENAKNWDKFQEAQRQNVRDWTNKTGEVPEDWRITNKNDERVDIPNVYSEEMAERIADYSPKGYSEGGQKAIFDKMMSERYVPLLVNNLKNKEFKELESAAPYERKVIDWYGNFLKYLGGNVYKTLVKNYTEK